MRILLIPIGGTIAAVLAIVVTRQLNAAHPPPSLPPPLIGGHSPTPPELPPVPEPPVRPTHTLFVEEGGGLRHKESGETFRTVEEALERLAPKSSAKPEVLLVPGSKAVTPERLEELAKKLRERCDVEILGGDSGGE